MTDLEPHYANLPAPERRPIARHPVHVVLDNLRSAYNVGSIFRTADAGAVEHLHLCGMSAHPPHPKLEKTALGAQEYVPWTYYERTKDAIKALQQGGIPVVAVEVTSGAKSIIECQFPRPVAIVFGNEVSGINEELLSCCDDVVTIPMQGYKNSMNVATAFGIVLYELLRQWNAI